MKITTTMDVVFDRENPPKVDSLKAAIKLLNILIKADGVTNDTVALKAILCYLKTMKGAA